MKVLVSLFLCFAYVLGDLYMMNPRGSNDRLNEANTNRDNANRLFDSQNNAKGGFCYGPSMSFYEGSLLSIEWTNQHGCGLNPKTNCNLVVQYMCTASDADPMIRARDGTTTTTIPDDPTAPPATTNGELTYGMHESYQSYQDCKTRDRNMGLFIADREAQGGLNAGEAAAIFTRQNNNGDRHGYECTEERDYYPYWHPAQWKDVAILTWNTDFCSFYQAESQNVKAKNFCLDPKTGHQAQWNNQAQCSSNGAQWTSTPAWGIAPPDCVPSPTSRENHLGNGDNNLYNPSYNWTMPYATTEACIKNNDCNCVLRLRYNISSGDTNNRPDSGFTDWTANGKASPVQNNPTPNVQTMNMTLALDTTQFGRTFQDRSYIFHMRPRPSGVLTTSRVWNLNVRGKRGNIVQTYPATEYDFAPQALYARVGDYIHFQWTGCDTNPAGNAGEGTDQTDRHNIVQVASSDSMYPASDQWLSTHTPLFDTVALRQRMAMLDQSNCLSYAALLAKNNANNNAVETDPQNCMKLNAAQEYFDGGLIRLNVTNDQGFFYISSRNNNFTNRDHKGALFVMPLLPTWALALVIVGSVACVLSGVVAGLMFYSKSHPHSGVANLFSKM